MTARRSWSRAPGRASAATALATVSGLMFMPTVANAAVTGSIMGTVSAPKGFQLVVTICAIGSGGDKDCATTLATNIDGNSPGAYLISGLAGGEYKVSFEH